MEILPENTEVIERLEIDWEASAVRRPASKITAMELVDAILGPQPKAEDQ